MLQLENMKMSLLQKGEEPPYELLLLADPSMQMLDSYLSAALVYLFRLENKVIAVYVLYPLDNITAEIKNIAVAETFQNQGAGKLLLQHAIESARKKGYKKLLICTGNSSMGQLYLYQKMGFEPTEIIPDFFVKNYKDPIYENGIQCKHKIQLIKLL